MTIPADVSNTYMALGYAVVALILFGIVAYLVSRARQLRTELAMLQSLDNTPKADVETTSPR